MSYDEAFDRFERTTLRSQVTEQLREAILGGALKPGERIVEVDLARRMGISRGPLREAIQRLREEGLVECVDGRGAFVKELSLSDIEELYQVRAVLEGLAARLATERLSAAEREQLRGQVPEMWEAARKGDVAALARLNRQFHGHLLQASGNSYLINSLSRLYGLQRMVSVVQRRYLEDLPAMVAAHEAILDCVLGGDAEGAERLMRGHILKDVDFSWPVGRIVWQHHERMDGSGYPLGLTGEDILIEARVLAVADVVEAMASARSYRPTPGLEKALEEIQRQRALLYDPAVVDACIRIFREKDFRLA